MNDKITNFNDRIKNDEDLKDNNEEITEEQMNEFITEEMMNHKPMTIEFKIGIYGKNEISVVAKDNEGNEIKEINMEDVIVALATLDVFHFNDIANKGKISNMKPEDVLNTFGYIQESQMSMVNQTIENILKSKAKLDPYYNAIYQIILLQRQQAEQFMAIAQQQQRNMNSNNVNSKTTDSGIILPS